MAASLVGVGVGPGDPGLLTLQALRALRRANRVYCPTMAAEAPGRAESIVVQADVGIGVHRLVFAIAGDADARSAAHDRAAQEVSGCLDAGQEVAFATLGDPNVYSTFHHLAQAVLRLRPGTTIRTVPGIMAFQDLAAQAGAVVTDGTQRLAMVSAADGPEALDGVLGDLDATIVIYKGGRHLPALARRLEAAGRLDGALFGELLGLPGQRVGAVRDHAGLPAAYLATVLVPPAARQ